MRLLILLMIMVLQTGCSALMVGFLLTPEVVRPAPSPTPAAR